MRSFVVSAWIAIVLMPGLLPATSDVRAADPPPNVLFVAVDDLNDWVGCFGGNPQCRTPNIDRLARRGTIFERAYCAAPACNPSRAALMTGIRPATSGVYHNDQPWRPAMPEAVTLSQHFSKHGYRSLGSGKIFHGSFPERASWDDYLSQGPDPKPVPAVADHPHSKAGGIVWGVLDVADADMNDHRMVDYAVRHLSQPHEKPFFLACGLYRPHMPWQVPRKYYDQYPLDRIELPKTLADDLADVPPAGVRMAKPEGDHATILRTDNWKYAVQAYLASIAFADAEIGRLLDALESGPHARNTVVVLWGDHGWHLGEKQHWRKFSLWEEAARVPLIVVAPGVAAPDTRCGRTVNLLDLYPTLSELCGLPVGPHLEGASLVPLLKDPQAKWDRPSLTTHGRSNHALRSERFRYIRYADGSEELYDHDADPLEWTNLSAKPEFAAVKQDLAKWLPKTNAPDAPTTGKNTNTKKKSAGAKKKAAAGK